MPDQNDGFSLNPCGEKHIKLDLSRLLRESDWQYTFGKQLIHIRISRYNILLPLSHRVPHTHNNRHESMRIYGVVRFVDVRIPRPMSFSSAFSSVPLCNPPNFL